MRDVTDTPQEKAGCFRCGFAMGFVAGMVALLAITLLAFSIHWFATT